MLGELLSSCSLPLEIGISPCSKTHEMNRPACLEAYNYLSPHLWQLILLAHLQQQRDLVLRIPHQKSMQRLLFQIKSQSLWEYYHCHWALLSVRSTPLLTCIQRADSEYQQNLQRYSCYHVAIFTLRHWQQTTNVNTLRPSQNGRHFPDDIFKCIFLNENVWISIRISLNFVPKRPIDNIPSLVQIMAWRRSGYQGWKVYWRIYASLGLNELKSWTICHARDLWKLARSCKQLCLLCLPYPWSLPGAASLSGFQSPRVEIHWVRQYLVYAVLFKNCYNILKDREAQG